MAAFPAKLATAIGTLHGVLTVQASPELPPPDCDMSAQAQATMAQAAIKAAVAEGWTLANTGKLSFTAGHAYGNNPQSRYGVYSFVDPSWGIAPADALLWVGCTPTALEYFSFRSYLFDTLHPTFGNPFASLGDSANNLSFNTSLGQTSPANMNATTAVITTADEATNEYLRQKLVGAGFPVDAINTDRIPSSLVHMGRDTLVHDTFVMLNRVSIFHDQAVKERYINSSWPVYMLYAPSTQARRPYPVVQRKAKGTGTDEKALTQSLGELQSKSEAFWKAKGFELSQQVQLYPIPINGSVCIPAHTNCGGDNSDAAYFSAIVPYFVLNSTHDDEFLLVTGVNHNATKKATYSNLVVEQAPPDGGVFNATCNGLVGVDSRSFPGSAAAFGVANDALFAQAIAANCSGLQAIMVGGAGGIVHCMEVPSAQVNAGSPLRVVTRAYLERATGTGPRYDELLWPSVMRFSRKKSGP